jgi:pyruvate,orthophosphate dikinase
MYYAPKGAKLKLADLIGPSKHHIFKFHEASASDKSLLGTKAANICEMSKLQLPIPPGFIMSTATCEEFFKHLEQQNRITKQCRKAIHFLEQQTGKIFAPTKDMMHEKNNENKLPLLLSVRASTTFSMPGMTDCVLNLGINDEVVEIMAEKTGDARWAYDTYRLFIQIYGVVVMHRDAAEYEAILSRVRQEKSVETDFELDVAALQQVVKEFKAVAPVHQDPWQQLVNTLFAVIHSWFAPKAVQYREMNNVRGEQGTAVIVQAMVFGNLNCRSGSGVAVSRNPATGECCY